MTNCDIKITTPSNTKGFVEYKRAFAIEGEITCKNLPVDTKLTVKLIDENNNTVRYVQTNKKNKEFVTYYKDLLGYEEALDPKREKMQEFGFPIMAVEDINHIEESINNATIKAWYSDNRFKAIIVSASNKAHGSVFESDFDLLDENNNPYDLLPMGEYLIEVSLYKQGQIDASAKKRITIGENKNQLICRFNPTSHRNAMTSWCKQNDFSIINEPLPGYLDPYLGTWYYHMGLLKTYRANDICLFEKADIKMFLYLIDETSTSYETELAYLQSNNRLQDENKFVSYYYDIGEAILFENKENQIKANINKFEKDEYIHLYRIDVVNNLAKENIYYLDQRHVENIITDINNIEVEAGKSIAITGVLKPTQLDPNDFILKNNNTYKINNYPKIMKYTFIIDDQKIIEEHKLSMERVEDRSIGKSVYEFYNLVNIKQEWKNKNIKVIIENIDAKGNYTQATTQINIEVK